MSGIRTRLADALQEAINKVPVGVPDATDWPNYLADVVLSLPGIAIVDVNDEATLDRAAEAIWEVSVPVPDLPDYHGMARAALLAAASEKPLGYTALDRSCDDYYGMGR